ncbi:MAG: hypothetical protein AB7O82_08720 [Reyranella sp.]
MSIREALINPGHMLAPGTARELSDFLRAEVAKHSAVVRRSGMRLE